MPIAWYDNVPLISWLVLRGRCRSCAAPISIRYPVVELLSGVLWLAAAARFGFTLQAAIGIAFFYVMLLLAFIDMDTMRLPNALVAVLAGIGVCGLAVSQLAGVDAVPLMPLGSGLLSIPVVFSFFGAVVCAGSVAAIAFFYARFRGHEGFGMGDIKLLLVIGLFLGPYGLLVLFVASVLGAAYGVVTSRAAAEGLRTKFPFGPFLVAGSVLVTLFGAPAFAWYVRLIAL